MEETEVKGTLVFWRKEENTKELSIQGNTVQQTSFCFVEEGKDTENKSNHRWIDAYFGSKEHVSNAREEAPNGSKVEFVCQKTGEKEFSLKADSMKVLEKGAGKKGWKGSNRWFESKEDYIKRQTSIMVQNTGERAMEFLIEKKEPLSKFQGVHETLINQYLTRVEETVDRVAALFNDAPKSEVKENE